MFETVVAFLLATLAMAPAKAITQNFNVIVSISGNSTPFSLPTGDVLHYVAPMQSPPSGWNVGSDSNTGLDQLHPWASPNHAMNCGDVILAAPGNYYNSGVMANGWSTWGAVSNCPSTTGGIDGNGGIYAAVVLCTGDLGSNGCSFQFPGTCAGGGFYNCGGGYFNNNNWAIEGFQSFSSATTNAGPFGFGVNESGSPFPHHTMMINDISYNNAGGYATQDNGNGTLGTDYMAVVGSIGMNAAQDSFCVAAIDYVTPVNADAVAGTHMFAYGNFLWKNAHPSGCTDGEDIMLDTWDQNNFTGKGAFVNNIGVRADRFCLHIFWQNHHDIPSLTIKEYNNTCYGNLQNTQSSSGPDGPVGEFNLGSSGGTNANPAVSITKNIGQTTSATSPTGGSTLYAGFWGGLTWPNLVIGGTGSENVFKGLATTCAFNPTCDAGNNTDATNGNTIGTNFYEDPAFNNVTDLLNNRMGTPNCTGFFTTTACMGWNATTQVLTNPSFIYDLQPTCADCSGKGYQLPSTTCVTQGTGIVADFPAWLKGIVYLQWTGTALVQVHDLVTTPCGL